MNTNDNQAGISTYLAVLVVLIIGAVVFFALQNNNSGQNNQQQQAQNQNQQSMAPAEAPMMAHNSSNQPGTVTLTEVDGSTVVVIDLTPGPKGVEQPAHINLGSCDQIGSLKYNLNPVVDGKSETTLQPALHFIHGLGQLTVNVRKSAAENMAIISCGPITQALDAVMNADSDAIRGDLQTEGTLNAE